MSRTLFFLCLVLGIAFVVMTGSRDVFDVILNRSVPSRPTVWPSYKELLDQGMSGSPYEETVYLGPMSLVEPSKVIEIGMTRRIAFADGTGSHFEALIECEPRIENQKLYVYVRRSLQTKREVYYAQCLAPKTYIVTRPRPG